MFHTSPRRYSVRLIIIALALVGFASWATFLTYSHSENAKRNLSRKANASKKGGAERSGAATPDDATRGRVGEAYGNLPLSFEANRGQTDSRVSFLSRGRGYSLFLTSTEAVMSLRKPDSAKTSKPKSAIGKPQSAVVRMRLVGANPAPYLEGRDQLPGKINYFIGNDPSKWHTDISTYQKVHYSGAYPGIDLDYRGNQRQLEYDFVIAPGASAQGIKLAFEGARKIRIDESGDLLLQTAGGEIRQRKPLVYQDLNGVKQEISGGYVLKDKQEVGFQVAAYDATRSLIIDPVLNYSTYVGGSSDDEGNGIAVDPGGNAYVTGITNSANFPTANPLQPSLGGTLAREDAFVMKLNASGSALIFSTYLGGSQSDVGQGIAVDAVGDASVTGNTFSTDFPTTPGAFQTTNRGNGDAFVAKLNPTGSALVYSTYLGGSASDLSDGIALDAGGNAYVRGSTFSSNFPTANPLQPTLAGNNDIFVSKLNSTGSALVYSTYLGGSSNEGGQGIAVDVGGNCYVSGYTLSTNFPTMNPFQATKRLSTDAFVSKLDPTGSAFIYSTYLGGNNSDEGRGIAADAFGNAYVTGHTGSTDFPTMNPLQPTFAGSLDGFVTKLNSNGSSLIYSTYFGGSASEVVNGIAVDFAGNAYVTGQTNSTDLPTTNAVQPIFGGFLDAFVMKLNAGGSALVYSTFLGGSENESGLGIAVDSFGDAYVTGFTESSDFPSANPLQATFAGVRDAFVAKISDAAPTPTPTPTPSADLTITKTASPSGSVATNAQITYTITVNNVGPGDASSVSVNDPIPPGTTFSSFTTSQGSCTAPSVGSTSPPLNCSLGTITAGGSATITLKVDVTALPGATISNTATVSSTTSDPNTNNNSASTNNSVAGCDLVVNNTNDSGAHSLRLAIQCANANPGFDTITFSIAGAGVHTIQPFSNLPPITDPLVINGYSQPGSSANNMANGDNAVVLIEISGQSVPAPASGLFISGAPSATSPTGGNGSTIRGLVINRFTATTPSGDPQEPTGGNGISLQGSSGNFIQGNFLGTDPTGTQPRGNFRGVGIDSGSSNNIVGGATPDARNLLSGNTGLGVGIRTVAANSPSTGNQVQGNFIGTTVSGTGTLGNFQYGVLLNNSPGNTVGGTTASARNVISGNNFGVVIGVTANNPGFNSATNNQVLGNYIGTDVSGTAEVGNNSTGVNINNSASNNIIGGTATGARNVISGNHGNGISISGATGNAIRGNYIGLDTSGTAALGNSFSGVLLNGVSNTVGGLVAGAGNVISGNNSSGILIQFPQNLVQGNFIGTNAAGTAALGNFGGIVIQAGASGNTIGGTSAGARNVISGNDSSGVSISGGTSSGNFVQGNFIGTNAAGTAALGNSFNGLLISGAPGNTIGGTSAGAGNVISGTRSGVGIQITGTGGSGNLVQGNFIGTNAAGMAAIPNFQEGVRIDASNNTVGGLVVGARNVVSGNNRLDGISLSGGASGNQVQGNFIGTDVTGGATLGNGRSGILISGASNNIIGGTVPGARNVISGNLHGVDLTDTATANEVQGNFIGTDVTGTVALGQRSAGVHISGAANNKIGGTTAGARNIISGNNDGVQINNSATTGTTGNLVQGNFIGTDVTGTKVLPNFRGVTIGFAPNNTIGGTTAGAGNVISGNLSSGVAIGGSGATGNIVQGNLIGTDVTGTVALANDGGVGITSPNNVIGGTAPGARNVISGNTANGIHICCSATGNMVQGNFIGTDVTGTKALGNGLRGFPGVLIEGSVFEVTSDNIIGGATSGAGNVVSGNNFEGLMILGSGAMRNLVQGNFIGTQADGASPLGNQRSGVRIGDSSSKNTIGGTESGAGNTIAFNGLAGSAGGSNGVVVFSGSGNTIRQNSIFSNAGLGIDLGADEATPNDQCDTDTAANNLQNFPILTSVFSAGGSTTIQGKLNSTPLRSFTIEFFSNTTGDPSGFGEGQTFIGSTIVTTGADCNANFSAIFPIVISPDRVVTATATDQVTNDTSEFSAWKRFDTEVDLAITKTDGQTSAVPGSQVTYTITVTNNGPGAATGPTVTDNFPASLKNVTWSCTASAGSSCGAASGSGNIDATVNLLPNGTATFTATGTLSRSATGTLDNTACVSPPRGVNDPNNGNNCATDSDTVTATADVSVTKTDSPDPVVVGGTLTYTITVNNSGPSTATNVSLIDMLPASVTFGSAMASQGSCTQSGGTVMCSLGSLADGGSATVTIAVTPNTAGTITNTTTVSAKESDPNTNNNTATETTTVNKANTTTVITSDNPDPSVVGQPYKVSFTVSNAQGSGTPTGMVTVDDGTGATCSGTLSGGSGSCQITSTSAGDKTLTATYSGDSNFNSSSGTAAHLVDKANTTTSLTSSQNPSTFGQPVTFTATVTAVAPGTGTPTGTVQFKIEGVNFGGPVTLVNGSATSNSISTLSVGTHLITAEYSGNSNYNTSTGTLIQTVVLPPSTAQVKVTGGGSIALVTGGKGTFGLVGMVSSTGTPSGNVEYHDQDTRININATTITAIVVTGTHGQIFGEATINGSGSFDFVVDVDDLAEPGDNIDTFRIELSNGYVAGGTLATGGNVQIHK